jgi:hypothetical protein
VVGSHPVKTENRSRIFFVLEPLGFARGGEQGFLYFMVCANRGGGYAAGQTGHLNRLVSAGTSFG